MSHNPLQIIESSLCQSPFQKLNASQIIFTYFFQQNIGSQLWDLIDREISMLVNRNPLKEIPTAKTHFSIRNTFKSLLLQFPMHKHNTFTSLDDLKISPIFLKKVIFVKIVNEYQLIFLV